MKTRKIMALVLSIVMVFSLCSTAFAAHLTDEVTELEQQNGDLSHFIATQSYVLLENNGVLPLEKVGSVAIFGNGSVATIKGGTGSGAVNNRYNDNVYEAFVAAGWEIANPSFIATQTKTLREERAITDAELAEATANTDLAIYVISRQAGEFADRNEVDFTRSFSLSPAEQANIALLAENFDRFVIVYNTCMMDTDAARETEGVDAVFFMSNGGSRGSEALVDVLTGEVTPSGKLTDTWALDLGGKYGYPSTDNGFASNDGNTNTEWYYEGIYNGYRYFDTWGVPVAYEFGFGMSYTSFDIDVDNVEINGEAVTVDVSVTNTGNTYSGKEVVQVYFSAPDGRLEKPYQELAAFGKTDELAPGEKQTLTITFATTDMSSYDEELAAYIMEAGDYIIRVGNSSRNTEVAAVATLDTEDGYVITEQLSNQLHLEDNNGLWEFSKEGETPITYEGEAEEIAAAPRTALVADEIPYVNNASDNDEETVTTYLFAEDAEDYVARDSITLRTKTVAGILQNNTGNGGYMTTTYAEVVEIVPDLPEGITAETAKLTDVYEGKITMQQFLACLSSDECARIAVGGAGTMEEPAEGETYVGAQASAVQGGAGQTTQAYYLTRYIPAMPNADGPAGIRITQHYWLGDNGVKYTNLSRVPAGVEVIDQYQFCTAFPAGSCYAMSWDVDLMYREGVAVGSEMIEYGVTTWLAPGLNIHRNPICGRNFEYYSEDPLVTGICAAYITRGVQSNCGIGVTIKHFWGNSQETNRNRENNVISERTAREIYIKGFEIAVKLAQPMCVMNCYNENNGWPGSDDWDTNEDILRNEWGFKGAVMTDWGGGQSSPLISMHAGCDMIMSGGDSRLRQVREAVGIVEPTFAADGSIKAANSFEPAAGGAYEFYAPVENYAALSEAVLEAIEAGEAKFCSTANGNFVTWYGNYINKIVLGDVQKAASRVLQNALDSQDMVKLYADLLDAQISAPDISVKREALLTQGWTMATKGDIVNVGIVADTVVADNAVSDIANVDITYTGDAALTSARLYIESDLEAVAVESDYDFEWNQEESYIVVYAADGSEIDGVLCTVTYVIADESGWFANGTYPVDVTVVDATGADAEPIVAKGVDGAVIIDNDYAAGDVNLDGSLTNADLIAVARYLVDLVEFTDMQLEIADVDGNGEVNNSDLIRIARGIVDGRRLDEAIGTYKVVVEGYDWGAASTKLIVNLDRTIDAESVEATDFNVLNTTQGCFGSSTSTRRVTDAYVSDAEGNEVAEDSNYVALEMYVSPNEGGAFYYNFMGSGHNVWPDPYYFTVEIASNDGIKYSGVVVDHLTLAQDPAEIICPLADQFEQHTFEATDGTVLNYGSWAPAADDAKNPLIIWLHGAGEGGTDNDIVAMGNKVVNLITDEIQQYFSDEEISGAYVLTPQSPTMWMNDGTGNYTSDGTSCYTESLMELIKAYVDSNPDIDTNRIYVGGCSNGGYMTMNLIINNPEYFAAAYPICEAYTDSWITDEQIEAIKDIPIWFTHAANDTTVNPTAHTVATYNRLVAAGAENVHFSFFDDVHDTTGNYTRPDGTPYQYMGHWSWVYTLNNECVEEDGTTIMEWMAAQSK